MGSSDGIPINLILIVYMTGVDEHGWVCDVELAKRIILAHFSTMRYYGASVYGDKGFFLGGPDGWSGFIICTLDAWLKDETSCEEANEDILSVVEVDGKPVVFLLHESD